MLTSGIETSDLKETYLKLFLDKKEILFSGSEIMNELREKALTAFSEKGLPAVKAENYKYTNISAAFGTSLRYISDHSTVELQSKDLSALHIPELDAYSLIVVNGFYADTKNSLVKLPNGIIYGSLKAASIQYPEIFRNHYGHYADFSNDGITALNTAFAIDGCFIYVPEKVTGEKPFRIIHMVNSSEPVMVQYRSLVILEKNASANIVISDTDLSISGFLANSVMEIFSGENSGLSLIRLQNEHDNSTHVTGTFIHQSGDSRVNTNYIILNGGLIRNNLLVNLSGEGAENKASGLFFGNKKQHIDNFIYINHKKPECTSNQLYKGILDDESVGAFAGKIHVWQDAQHTQAYQRNNNILLTDTAKMHTKPQLEI
jgi:Fe-S cluster assembly protein SufD